MSKRLKDSITVDSNPEGINQYTGGSAGGKMSGGSKAFKAAGQALARGPQAPPEGKAAAQLKALSATNVASSKTSELEKREKTATTKEAKEMAKAHGEAAKAHYKAAELHGALGQGLAKQHQAEGDKHIRAQQEWKQIHREERGY